MQYDICCLNQDGSFVQHSHWIWYTHETSQINWNVFKWNIQYKPQMGTHLFDTFPMQNDLKEEDALLPLLLNLALEYDIWNLPAIEGGTDIEWDTSASNLC